MTRINALIPSKQDGQIGWCHVMPSTCSAPSLGSFDFFGDTARQVSMVHHLLHINIYLNNAIWHRSDGPRKSACSFMSELMYLSEDCVISENLPWHSGGKSGTASFSTLKVERRADICVETVWRWSFRVYYNCTLECKLFATKANHGMIFLSSRSCISIFISWLYGSLHNFRTIPSIWIVFLIRATAHARSFECIAIVRETAYVSDFWIY